MRDNEQSKIKQYIQPSEINTNTDKIKIALSKFTESKNYGKEIISNLIALLSLIFTVSASTFKSIWGIPASYIEYTIWTVIILLGLYIAYLFIKVIIIHLNGYNSLEWFINTLLGIETEKKRVSFKTFISKIYDFAIDFLQFIWTSIGYILLIIFYLFPILVLAAIGFWIGWDILFNIDGGVPYAVPYFLFGVPIVILVYVHIYSEEGLNVVDPVREFFDDIFDIFY